MKPMHHFNLAKKLSTARKTLHKRGSSRARIAPKMLIVAVGALVFMLGYRHTSPSSSTPEQTHAQELRTPTAMVIQEMTSIEQQQLRSTITHADTLSTLFEDPTTKLSNVNLLPSNNFVFLLK